MNHFEILDLTPSYDIKLSELKKKYLNKQVLYHPDRKNNDISLSEKLSLSMQLNEAYKILKDDYLRAEYMLKLLGQKFDDRALKNSLENEDLERIMDLHEKLDSITELSELESFKYEKLDEKNHMVKALSESFKVKDLSKALDITVNLKYLTNLVKNIQSKIKNANN